MSSLVLAFVNVCATSRDADGQVALQRKNMCRGDTKHIVMSAQEFMPRRPGATPAAAPAAHVHVNFDRVVHRE